MSSTPTKPPTKTLSNDRIQKFRCPEGKTQVFFKDLATSGLYVRVTPTGVKTFVFQWRDGNNKPRMPIGSVDTWLLEEARDRARELQRMVDDGIDPRAHVAAQELARAKEKEEQEQAKKYTLAELCRQYVAHLRTQGKISAKSVESVFSHVFKSNLANRPAKEVSSLEIAALIRKITLDDGKNRTGGILRSNLLAAYNDAIQSPLDPTQPAILSGFEIIANPVQPIRAVKVVARTRSLNAEELGDYLKALGDTQTDRFLKLVIYSGGQRLEQLLRAKTTDWDMSTNTLALLDPKGRRKTPRPHRLPLGPKAAEIVSKSLVDAANGELLFSMHPRTAGKRIKEIAKSVSKDPFDTRDLRRTCETMLAAMQVHKDTRSHLLSHGLGGVQDTHYDTHPYLEEKRGALLVWEQHLDQILEAARQRASSNHA